MHSALARREVTGKSTNLRKIHAQRPRKAVNRILTSRNGQAVRNLYGPNLTNAQVTQVMNQVINTTRNRRLIKSNATRNKNLNRYNWNKFMTNILRTQWPWHLMFLKKR